MKTTNLRSVVLERLLADLVLGKEISKTPLDDFLNSPILQLAAEGLANRVGESVKQLAKLDPEVFGVGIFRDSIRYRDKIVHHYFEADQILQYRVITQEFLKLEAALAEVSK